MILYLVRVVCVRTHNDVLYFIQLLVALKVRHPHRITILRGNHESRQVLMNIVFLILM